MYTALIIDDESDARGVLRKMLELFCPLVNKAYEAVDGKSALELAKKYQPDIAFVDIRLRNESGLDVAKKVGPYCSSLIFVTAYDGYAIEAFEAEALHYLLKPVDPEQLQAAINRAAQKLGQRSPASITLNTKKGLLKLQQASINFVQGEGNYCTFSCQDGRTHFVSKNLAYYAVQLDPSLFVRIHQSYLVRIASVEQYLVQDGYFAILKSGQKLPISRRRKDDFLRALSG